MFWGLSEPSKGWATWGMSQTWPSSQKHALILHCIHLSNFIRHPQSMQVGRIFLCLHEHLLLLAGYNYYYKFIIYLFMGYEYHNRIAFTLSSGGSQVCILAMVQPSVAGSPREESWQIDHGWEEWHSLFIHRHLWANECQKEKWIAVSI